mmetsp:Transcript_12947/g.27972  ORF Transcript_12947/g.27972 Transcript_12947/m.27972 type:complete len:85 (-) Transcript_12947:106-360(-)
MLSLISPASFLDAFLDAFLDTPVDSIDAHINRSHLFAWLNQSPGRNTNACKSNAQLKMFGATSTLFHARTTAADFKAPALHFSV